LNSKGIVQYEEVKKDCEKLWRRLRDRKVWLGFYSSEPSWKLYLFDDRVFVSYFNEPPPHSEKMLVFSRGTPIFGWLYREFLSLCPGHWKDSKDVITYAATCELPHIEHELESKFVFDSRERNKLPGNSDTDWEQAGVRIRERIRDELMGNLLPKSPEKLPGK